MPGLAVSDLECGCGCECGCGLISVLLFKPEFIHYADSPEFIYYADSAISETIACEPFVSIGPVPSGA